MSSSRIESRMDAIRPLRSSLDRTRTVTADRAARNETRSSAGFLSMRRSGSKQLSLRNRCDPVPCSDHQLSPTIPQRASPTESEHGVSPKQNVQKRKLRNVLANHQNADSQGRCQQKSHRSPQPRPKDSRQHGCFRGSNSQCTGQNNCPKPGRQRLLFCMHMQRAKEAGSSE